MNNIQPTPINIACILIQFLPMQPHDKPRELKLF